MRTCRVRLDQGDNAQARKNFQKVITLCMCSTVDFTEPLLFQAVDLSKEAFSTHNSHLVPLLKALAIVRTRVCACSNVLSSLLPCRLP